MFHAYCMFDMLMFDLNPCWKKMRLQLALNKTLCPTRQPLTHRWLKHHQRTKINKIMLSSSPSSVFSYKVQNIRIEKQISIPLTVIELGPSAWESSTRNAKFYAPTGSENKFNITEIKNWLPIAFNLGSSWLGTCSHNHCALFNR